jgi:MFS family permease
LTDRSVGKSAPTTRDPRAEPTESTGRSAGRSSIAEALLAPIRAFRLRYLPLLMVYFAYGALGLTAIAQTFWVKKELTSLSAADLAGIAVWLTLPWTVKMVFGELVDTVAILGSRRRVYVFLGAGLVALGLVLLAGAAGKWITVLPAASLYVIASLLTTTGVVLQDVVADAMSTEVVARLEADGRPRPEIEVDRDLGMVQVLGRLALSLGILSMAGLAGWLAQVLAYETVFLIGLAIPLISVTGAAVVKLEPSEARPTDWRILGGGLGFGAVVAAIGLSGLALGQELVLAVSLIVILYMLARITRELDPGARSRLFAAAALIFVFRAMPGIGQGYSWFSMDVLGFNEGFFGTLQQTGALIGLVAIWLLSDAVTRRPVTTVMLWLVILGAVLALPNLALIHGLHHWSERAIGIGAHEIALVDAAAQSPLIQLSMIPMLTLIARSAPAGHRATWFALMASLMNLALVAAELGTKGLNMVFTVPRGNYAELPALAWTVVIIGLTVPIVAIMALGPRIIAGAAALPESGRRSALTRPD